MTCAIYVAMSAAMKLNEELERFAEDLPARLRADDSKMFPSLESKWDEENEVAADCFGGEWVQRGATLWVPAMVKGRGVKGKRRERLLSFRLDLHRDRSGDEDWAHASDALLVVAFWGERDEYWCNDELVVSPQGRLANEEVWSKCGANREFNGRLLLWLEPGEKPCSYSEGCWLFAIPLRTITDPDELDRRVVKPIVALLTESAAAAAAIEEAQAIKWAVT